MKRHAERVLGESWLRESWKHTQAERAGASGITSFHTVISMGNCLHSLKWKSFGNVSLFHHNSFITHASWHEFSRMPGRGKTFMLNELQAHYREVQRCGYSWGLRCHFRDIKTQCMLEWDPGKQHVFAWKLEIRVNPKHPSSSLLSKDISARHLLPFFFEGPGVGTQQEYKEPVGCCGTLGVSRYDGLFGRWAAQHVQDLLRGSGAGYPHCRGLCWREDKKSSASQMCGTIVL